VIAMTDQLYSLAGRMEEVEGRLSRTRTRWLRSRLGAGRLGVWSLAAAALLLLTLAGVLWDLPGLGYSVAMWAIVLVAVARSAWVARRAIREWPTTLQLALSAGRQDPRLGTRLLGGLELWKSRRHRRQGYSLALIEAAAEDSWRLAADTDFDALLPPKPLRNSSRILAVSLAGWVALSLASPDGVISSLKRFPLILMGEAVPAILVQPGNCEVPPGESLAIRAVIDAPDISEATLAFSRDGLEWRAVSLEHYSDSSDESELSDWSDLSDWSEVSLFHGLFPSIERPFRYMVNSGKASSDTFSVGIRARPKVVRIRVDYDYPTYTGLPDRKGMEGEGRVTALRGTEAKIHLEASRALKSAEFVLNDRDTLAGTVLENRLSAIGRIPVLEDGRYLIRVIDEEGYGPDRADVYPIVCLADESPMVRLERPEAEATLPPDMAVMLEGRAYDDYGFSKVLLHFYKFGSEEEETLKISGPIRVKEYAVDYAWNVSDLALLPGDVLNYYVEVWDNDAVSGAKRAATEVRSLRFPSVMEIFAGVEELEEEKIEDLEAVFEEEDLLRDRLQEISRELKREESLSWEARKEIERVAEKQEEINEKLGEIAAGIDEAMDMLERNELVSMEILEKMAQLRDLVEEVATPEMREAMRKLQEAIDQLDQEEIRKALQDFEMTQEELLERLERSIELLERLRIERKMEELAERAENLAERQAELTADAETAPPDSLANLAGQEDRIAAEASALEKDISKAAEIARELEPQAADALESIAQAMEQDETVARLQAARDALSSGRPSEAQSKTRQGSESLEQLAENLRLAQNFLSMEKRRQLAEMMERLTHDLVWFSFEEEDIAEEVQTLRTRDLETRRDVAERQLSLRTCTSKLLQRLRELARQTFMVSPEAARSLSGAMEHMQSAARILESGNIQPADQEGLEAMALINRSVLALMESKQCMSSCSSPMGLNQMLQKMQSMSCQQAGLNQATQQLLSQMGQQGLSMQARAQAARLGAEQTALRKSAQTLAGEMGDQPQILGRMEGLISEMEKVIRDLESAGLSAETIDRQKRILSRLLDAQKSARRRDYTRVRLSRVGRGLEGLSPSELPPETRWVPSEIKEDLLKAAGETYPLRYESLIRSYFRALAMEGVEESSAPREP